MSQFLRKYGAGAKLRIPMIKAGVRDFAVAADWTPATGDVKVSKDGGAIANIGTLPAAISGSAMWEFTLSAAEMQATEVTITVIDSATKAVEDQLLSVISFGNSAAGLSEEALLSSGVIGTVSTANNAGDATHFRCSDITEATAGHYVGKQAWVMKGTLLAQWLGVVTAYALTASEGAFTVSPGSPSAETLASTDKVFIF